VEVPLVLSHLVFRRDVGGHGLAAGVVGHDLLLERHHLLLVSWVGAAVSPGHVVLSFVPLYRVKPGLEGLLVFPQPLGEQPDLVILVYLAVLVSLVLG
jgi:hypothetical protein